MITTVPIKTLRFNGVYSCFWEWVWWLPVSTVPHMPVERIEINRCLEAGTLLCEPWHARPLKIDRAHHIRRVAYFVVHPFDPIDIEVRKSGYWYLADGYHRYTAAVYRGDLAIGVDFFGFYMARGG